VLCILIRQAGLFYQARFRIASLTICTPPLKTDIMEKHFFKATVAAIFTCLILFTCQNADAQQQPGPDPDLKSKVHQFDFWLGEWDVYKYGTDTIVGRSHIQSVNDSTGILENYHTPGRPFKGKSLNTYNKKTGNWEQYWIDNTGTVLKLEGGISEGKMVMTGFEGLRGSRITWQSVEQGVRQTWEMTADGGKTWIVVFDGLYVRLQ